jgi:hypothetical protein
MEKFFMLKRILACLIAVPLLLATAIPAMAATNPIVTDEWQSGNAASECSLLPGEYEYAYKVDAAAPNGTWTHEGNSITILNSDGKVFDWSATKGIGAVIVKAGTGANVWAYDPQVKSNEDLYAYENREVSHVTFCWNFQVLDLEIDKTVETSYTSTWTWDILKKAVDEMTRLTGVTETSSHIVAYIVELTASKVDSDFKVMGTITIENPNDDVNAVITNVTDVLNGTYNATVNCGVTFPYTLDAEAKLECPYEISNSNTMNYTENVATVTTSGDVPGSSVTKAVSFMDATVTQIDECVDVSDDLAGSKGTVCANQLVDGKKTINYSLTFQYDAGMASGYVALQCGEVDYTNTASFITNDNGLEGDDSWTVSAYLDCFCSLSQGYWFAKPGVAWPDANGLGTPKDLTIGGFHYDRNDGLKIWNSSNRGGIRDAKKAFLQLSALYLSMAEKGVTSVPTTLVYYVDHINNNELMNRDLTKNIPTRKDWNLSIAADEISKWIDANHCTEEVLFSSLN